MAIMSSFKNYIKSNCNIVILTGAGISAESGLKTFRASDGLWEGHRVEDVATPGAFSRNPSLVYQFYNERRRSLFLEDVRPNPAHKALADLEVKWPAANGGEVFIVTQNIDNLHERGGSKNVVHMHGELLKMFCSYCCAGSTENALKYTIKDDLDAENTCPSCKRKGVLRPDIVWFGEMPYSMDLIGGALQECDLFVSVGTSGNVYPAAGFVREALYAGAYTVEVNLESSLTGSSFHEGIYGHAGTKIPEFVDNLLNCA